MPLPAGLDSALTQLGFLKRCQRYWVLLQHHSISHEALGCAPLGGESWGACGFSQLGASLEEDLAGT